ncbi:hypothetical protein [Bradyrhizobium murdochi]|uniref:hypothetical protein n=1 Tax=Bradyrhizobium murdochi TaxID=1038859 RepID=UPI0003FE733B|nr:hypothetical protein [Bradyrhizobium murdochi]
MMNKSDIDWALHQIQQMVIIARRSTQGLKPSKDIAYLLMPVGQHESLEFSLGDILDKVTALKEGWDDTEHRGKAAPDAASDGEGSRPTDRPIRDWNGAYTDIEGSICDAVHMIDIAAEFANDTIDRGDQLTFAVNQSQQMMEDLKKRYYENWEAAG